MIRFSHAYKVYPGPIHALSDVDLFVDKGEFVFLTGLSGAGKTTLFKMISAYDKLSSGRLSVGGYDLVHIKPKDIPFFRRTIGIVFQDFRLLKDQSVFDNVSLPLLVRGDRPQYIRKKVEEILYQVGLWFKKDQFPEQLSGGEQQRVAIARAVIHQPEVLVADEPTGNLDPDMSEQIMELFERVNARGTTVFVATHEHDLVRRRSKRAVEIRAGRIINHGVEESLTLSEFNDPPKEALTQ